MGFEINNDTKYKCSSEEHNTIYPTHETLLQKHQYELTFMQFMIKALNPQRQIDRELHSKHQKGILLTKCYENFSHDVNGNVTRDQMNIARLV